MHAPVLDLRGMGSGTNMPQKLEYGKPARSPSGSSQRREQRPSKPWSADVISLDDAQPADGPTGNSVCLPFRHFFSSYFRRFSQKRTIKRSQQQLHLRVSVGLDSALDLVEYQKSASARQQRSPHWPSLESLPGEQPVPVARPSSDVDGPIALAPKGLQQQPAEPPHPYGINLGRQPAYESQADDAIDWEELNRRLKWLRKEAGDGEEERWLVAEALRLPATLAGLREDEPALWENPDKRLARLAEDAVETMYLLDRLLTSIPPERVHLVADADLAAVASSCEQLKVRIKQLMGVVRTEGILDLAVVRHVELSRELARFKDLLVAATLWPSARQHEEVAAELEAEAQQQQQRDAAASLDAPEAGCVGGSLWGACQLL